MDKIEWTCDCGTHGWRRKHSKHSKSTIAFAHLMSGYIRMYCLSLTTNTPLSIIDMCINFVGLHQDSKLGMMFADAKRMYGPIEKKDKTKYMIHWNDRCGSPADQLRHFFDTTCYSTNILSKEAPLKIDSFLSNHIVRAKFMNLIKENILYTQFSINPIIHCINQIQSLMNSMLKLGKSPNSKRYWLYINIWISVIQVLLDHSVDSFFRCIYCNTIYDQYTQYHHCHRCNISGLTLHWNALKLLLLSFKDLELESSKYYAKTSSDPMISLLTDKLCKILSIAINDWQYKRDGNSLALARIEIRSRVGADGFIPTEYYIKFHKILSYIPSFEILYKLLSLPNCIPFAFIWSYKDHAYGPRKYTELHEINDIEPRSNAEDGLEILDDTKKDDCINVRQDQIFEAMTEAYLKRKGKVVIPLYWKMLLLFTQKKVIMDALTQSLPHFSIDVLSVIYRYVSDQAYFDQSFQFLEKNKNFNVYKRTINELDYQCFSSGNKAIFESWMHAMKTQLLWVKKTPILDRRMKGLLNKMTADNYDLISKQTLDILKFLFKKNGTTSKKRINVDDDHAGCELRDNLKKISRCIVCFASKQPFFAHNFAMLLKDVDGYLKSVSYNECKVDKFVLALMTKSIQFENNKFDFFGAMVLIAQLYNCDMFTKEYVNNLLTKQIDWKNDKNVEGVLKFFMKLKEEKRISLKHIREKLNSVQENFDFRIKCLISLIP